MAVLENNIDDVRGRGAVMAPRFACTLHEASEWDAERR